MAHLHTIKRLQRGSVATKHPSTPSKTEFSQRKLIFDSKIQPFSVFFSTVPFRSAPSRLHPWPRHQPFSHSYPILSPPWPDPSPLASSPRVARAAFPSLCLPRLVFLLSAPWHFSPFPQTLFSSYGSYNNGLKICLLLLFSVRLSLSLFFSFPVLILPVALSMKGESERGERWRAGGRAGGGEK